MARKRGTAKRRVSRSADARIARILAGYAGRWAGTGRRAERGIRRKLTGGRKR